MNLRKAIKALYEGNKVALPEWGGYWYVKDGKICVHTKDGEETETPWFGKYADREDWLVVEVHKNPELAQTATQMLSSDYKERFKAEYIQLRNRRNGLKRMCEKWDAGTLEFTPTCPRSTYDIQLTAMDDYLAVLEGRAELEEIEL